MKYLKRVSAELEMVGGGSEEEELIVQGVKFAFRAHQVYIFLYRPFIRLSFVSPSLVVD